MLPLLCCPAAAYVLPPPHLSVGPLLAAHAEPMRFAPSESPRMVAHAPEDASIGVPSTSSVPARRLEGTGKPTVWSEFGQLAAETGAVNLGQGFPDWQPPKFVVDQMRAAMDHGHHQYTRPAGHPQLVEVLAKRYSKHFQRPIDAMTEVCTTVGASQALYLTLQALVNPGDEVVLLEPAFDLYYGQIRLAGGHVVPVPLRVDEQARAWTLDVQLLAAAITPETKLLVLNSPHNPTGKTFSQDEMEAIADIVRKHPSLLVIADEVYKYTVYSGEPHIHFASLPDMFSRTVTLSSAGKTFSITGWQASSCAIISSNPIDSNEPMFMTSAAPWQALSQVLTLADEPYRGHSTYYGWLTSMYRKKRKILADGLEKCGLVAMEGQGGFFLIADTSSLTIPEKYLSQSTPASGASMTRDWALCRWLAYEAGVIAIPASPFYSAENKHRGKNYIRFAFCKSDETLHEAVDRIYQAVQREKGRHT